MKPISLARGDSSDLILIRPNIADDSEVISADWVCRTKLVEEDFTEIVAERVESTKTDDELNFVVGLSPTDTESVTVEAGKKFKRVFWVVQVSNTNLTPAYSREKMIPVVIRNQAIVNN